LLPADIQSPEPDRIRWFENGLEQLGHSILYSIISSKAESLRRTLERLPVSPMPLVTHSDLLLYETPSFLPSSWLACGSAR